MGSRLSFRKVAPRGMQVMLDLERHNGECGLEPALLELVRLRASQINGCVFCLAMHADALRAHGETERRLDLLPAWREAPVYSQRERAALAWTEALTRLSADGVPDELYAQALEEFGEKGLADLTLALGTINVWNRINVAFRTPPAD